jgi:Arc/MetJ-type ribon-helix-helix transcriptional regulator
METLQIRLTRNMLDRIDQLITIGEYPNRSEAVRDSVRKLLDNKRVYNNVLNVSEKDLQKFIKITDK